MSEQQVVLEKLEIKVDTPQSRDEPSKRDQIKFEQYKLMVSSTFEISKNRHTANNFYLTINALLSAP